MEQRNIEKEDGHRPVRLLSLDGGGIRGLSCLYILRSIMTAMQKHSPQAERGPLRPCEHFDLIAGTSTGGLIAVMLGILRMDIDTCIKAYLEIAPDIFPVESMFSNSTLGRFTKVVRKKERFSPIPFENAIKRLVADHLKERATDGENTPMKFEVAQQGSDRLCKVFVCVTSEMPRRHFRFRSYDSSWSVQDDCTIWQACRATSAAPTLFPPVIIGSPPTPYVDGGLGHNNPIRSLMDEANHLWPNSSIGCIVSIGTGMGLSTDVGRSLTAMLKTLTEIATDTENVAREFKEDIAHRFPERKIYFRFNVNRGLEQVSLTEWEEMGRVKIATEDYLNEQWREVDICASQLSNSITPSQSCWFVPFERNQRFVGRTSELSQLQAELFVNGRFTKFAVVGLGGVGKTQIALELAYRMRDKYPECSVFWIPASTTASFQQAYLELARQLQISGVEDKNANIRKLVQLHLSQTNARQWLLIFDNADDIDMWIKKPDELIGSTCLIDCLPRHSKGSIVFTTRSQKTAVKLAQQSVTEVYEMDEEVATQLLSKSLVHKEVLNDQQAGLDLLKQLTFLPLAIVQAAAYINENKITPSEYLVLLEEKEEDVIELLAEDFEQEGRYRDAKNPVATTWLISFEQIRRLDPLAAEYLSFMSCFNPKAIPLSLLPLSQSRKQMVEAIGTLSAYSFITKRAADQAVDLHRLVHLATRNWLHTEDALAVWTGKAVAQLTKAFSMIDLQNRNIWRAYLPHVRNVLGSELVEDTEDRVELLKFFGYCLSIDGRYREAELPFTQALETRKRVLGPEHPDTLRSMANIASTYQNQGRWTEAEELDVQVLETIFFFLLNH
ncbi:hypothetical protein MMC07_009754 [Pseudocyphellaria aurata]|nr:hypothetical protein [Pseudocyphellaria aurata]